jgi:hypothetical protein
MLHMAFGIKNKALQYLVLQLLEQVADVAPYQYSVKGGGTPAAIKHVVKAMSNRPVWADRRRRLLSELRWEETKGPTSHPEGGG